MYLFAHFSRFCAGIGGLMSKNIAILASGNGTNAENIIRYFQNSESVNIGLVLAPIPAARIMEISFPPSPKAMVPETSNP